MAAPSKTYRDWFIAFGSGAFATAMIAFLLSIGAITVKVDPTTTTTTVPVTTTITPTTTKPTTTSSKSTTTSLTPPTTTTTTLAPPDAVTHGRQIGASNTGLVYSGVTESSLVSTGAITYGPESSGKTISGKLFTGRVTVTGDNITITGNKLLYGGKDSFGILVRGDHVTITGNTITAPANSNLYEPVYLDDSADFPVVSRNDISRGEQALTTYATNATIVENYMHSVTNVVTGGHPDGMEQYGGTAVIARNWIDEGRQDDAAINIAPYGSRSVLLSTITDNYLDGGSHLVLVDNQGNGIANVKVLRNDMGGHQFWSRDANYGPWHALLNSDNRPIYDTQAQLTANPQGILWPSSGADVNRWANGVGLTPNKTGQIALPAD